MKNIDARPLFYFVLSTASLLYRQIYLDIYENISMTWQMSKYEEEIPNNFILGSGNVLHYYIKTESIIHNFKGLSYDNIFHIA